MENEDAILPAIHWALILSQCECLRSVITDKESDNVLIKKNHGDGCSLSEFIKNLA